MANLSFNIERYDDTIMYMKKYIEIDAKLTEEQMNLLSKAYHEIVCSYRDIIEKINEPHKKADEYKQYKQFYIEKLDFYCNDFISLIESKLENQENEKKLKILFLKLKADYSRYLIEYLLKSQQCLMYEKISYFYQNAMNLSLSLACYDELYLKVVLNYSLFLHDIVGKKNEGLDLLRNCFNSATNELFSYICIDPYPSNSVDILRHMEEVYHDWMDEMGK